MITVLLVTIIILLTIMAINSFFPNSDKEKDLASFVVINLFIIPLVLIILGVIYYFFFKT